MAWMAGFGAVRWFAAPLELRRFCGTPGALKRRQFRCANAAPSALADRRRFNRPTATGGQRSTV
jgi:hypothetical protein